MTIRLKDTCDEHVTTHVSARRSAEVLHEKPEHLSVQHLRLVHLLLAPLLPVPPRNLATSDRHKRLFVFNVWVARSSCFDPFNS